MKKILITINLIIFFILINIFIFNIAYADLCKAPEKFFYDNQRGWFYGEYCSPKKDNIIKKEKKEVKEILNKIVKEEDNKSNELKDNNLKFLIEKEVKIPWDIIDNLDPDSISYLETKSRKIAISNPSYDNVKEYMKLQKYINDKSLKYMETFQLVSQTDPTIANWSGSIESTKFARDVKFNNLRKDKESLLKAFNNKAGLVIFYKDGCPYCEEEKRILNMFNQDYGMEYELVNIYEHSDLVDKFQVGAVPDIFIVFRDSNDAPIWRRIGVGLHAESELADIVYQAIQEYQNGGGFINGKGNL
jgi:conjugal transfer pilus assembly protein TraF